jgi:hypothetical protein
MQTIESLLKEAQDDNCIEDMQLLTKSINLEANGWLSSFPNCYKGARLSYKTALAISKLTPEDAKDKGIFTQHQMSLLRGNVSNEIFVNVNVFIGYVFVAYF